ncbi:HAD-like protein [Lactarius tabidus]
MSESLSQFKALIFDVYGTLVDWETGILTALSPILTAPDQEWTKPDALLAFSAVESDLQTKNPAALYSDILASAYDELSRRSGTLHGLLDATTPDRAMTDISGSDSGAEAPSLDVISSSQTQHSPAAVVFAASLAQWPIFPDTPAALARLSTFGLRLAVLSNVDRTSFTHTRVALERSGEFAFGAVYTAEDIGSYKPDPRNFEYAVAQLRAEDPTLERDQILVVAQSLPHDHVPARALGLSSVWIDRPDAVTCIDGTGVPNDRAAKEAFTRWRFRDLREFANAVEEARVNSS